MLDCSLEGAGCSSVFYSFWLEGVGVTVCVSGCSGLGLVKFGCGIVHEAWPYLFGN